MTIASIGLIAMTAAGLVAAGGSPQQPVTSAAAPGAAQQPAIERSTAPTAIQPGATNQAQPASSPEERAILDGFAALAKIYSEANAAALAELFLDDGMIVDPEGKATRGKAAIAAMYAGSFQESPGVKVEPTVEAVRFLTADVARVEGRSRLSSANGDASEFTRFSTLLVRRDGKWRIAEIREYPAPAQDVAPYERLKALEWMVGDWVDESDNNRVQSSIRWADKQSYLIRTYSIEIQGEKSSSGTMFIGWDPQSGQIKSWMFDSNGGHGEGLWTRTGDKEWVVKAQGVLFDGRPTSATQIHTIINKDSVKTSSIDRIIGGEVAPDIPDVVMVRKPPPAGRGRFQARGGHGNPEVMRACPALDRPSSFCCTQVHDARREADGSAQPTRQDVLPGESGRTALIDSVPDPSSEDTHVESARDHSTRGGPDCDWFR